MLALRPHRQTTTLMVLSSGSMGLWLFSQLLAVVEISGVQFCRGGSYEGRWFGQHPLCAAGKCVGELSVLWFRTTLLAISVSCSAW